MIPTTIQGIPCQIQVETIRHHPGTGNPFTADSDLDYYGYTEVEFTVYDRNGYRAKWLEAKMTGEDVGRIQEEIISGRP